jgi:hypothetical protein
MRLQHCEAVAHGLRLPRQLDWQIPLSQTPSQHIPVPWQADPGAPQHVL